MSPRAADTDHTNLTLFPPEAVEITLRVGLVGSQDHAQVMYTIHSATDSVLLEMWSNPHLSISQAGLEAVRALSDALELARTHVIPF